MLGNEDIDRLLVQYLDLLTLKEVRCMNKYVNTLIIETVPSSPKILSIVGKPVSLGVSLAYYLSMINDNIISFIINLLQDNHFLWITKLADHFDLGISKISDKTYIDFLLYNENQYALPKRLTNYFNNPKSSSYTLKEFLLFRIFEKKRHNLSKNRYDDEVEKDNSFKNYLDCFDIDENEEIQIIDILNSLLQDSRFRVLRKFYFPEIYNIIEKDIIMIIDLLTASIATNKINIINGIIKLREKYSVYLNQTILGDTSINRRIILLESLDNLICDIK